MSTSAIAEFTSKSSWREFGSRQCDRVLQGCVALNRAIPSPLFNRFSQMVLDGSVAALAMLLAFQLRFDGAISAHYLPLMWTWMAVVTVGRPACTWGLGAYDSIWRYFNLRDVLSLAWSALVPSVALLATRLLLWKKYPVTAIPISVILIDMGLFLLLAGMLRALRRAGFEHARAAAPAQHRAVIVGTADSLATAVRQVSVQPEIEVVGLLSPEKKLEGFSIAGFPVLSPGLLPNLLVRRAADMVFIAEAKMDCVGATVQTAAQYGAEVRLLPSAANVLNGHVRVSAQLDPERVLEGRSRAGEAPHPAVAKGFAGKRVLITGAGGSIGSEIARQVTRLAIERAILLDRDENSIFELQNQLAELDTKAPVAPVVGDIRDREQMRQIFERHRPDVVLHAAAYKHVPVMEQNPSEAVLNNVLGTRQVLELAIEFEAERFLMISTDKAVRPTSVMGATKRVAELVVHGRGAEAHGLPAQRTRTACVRFGNVVGSRGSVVPIFLRQIEAGGPITITDQEMTRYFMTIPEAVHLVMQAVTLSSEGTIYMLDMGDPVKITDLACRLIEMSGLRPHKDIEVRFVGSRAGEKLHEQLWYEDTVVSETEFLRVLAVQGRAVPMGFHGATRALEQAALARNEEEVLQLLREMPIDFQAAKSAAMIA